MVRGFSQPRLPWQRDRGAAEGGGHAAAPQARIFAVFYLYAVICATFIQFVLLPYILPDLHAGNGLLLSGDWLGHHQDATNLSQRIHAEGWDIWTLRPKKEGLLGIIGAVYALTLPEPWVLIPLHAALHAGAALVLLRITEFFVPDWRLGMWAVAPFLLYPSAMLWYAQILKDGYAIFGALLFLYGWLIFCRYATGETPRSRIVLALASMELGVLVAWVVRPYLAEVLQAVAAGLAVVLSAVVSLRVTRARIPFVKALSVIALAWCVVVFMNPDSIMGLRGGGAGTGESKTPESFVAPWMWKGTGWLPSSVEAKLAAAAQTRSGFFKLYPDALSGVDREVEFHSIEDMILYLPRAMQVGLLAPFPPDWFDRGSLVSTTIMRRVTGVEMLTIYCVLPGLFYGLWHWREKIETWMLVLYCSMNIVILVVVVPNVGALYRMRYGYLMTLVGLAITGLVAAVQQWTMNGSEASSSMAKNPHQVEAGHL